MTPSDTGCPRAPPPLTAVGLAARLGARIGVAPDLAAALRATVELVCRETGWPYGEAWLPAGDALVRGPVFHAGGAELERSSARSGPLRVARGEGLPGRAWADRTSLWLPDMTAELGAAAVPVPAGDEVAAVLVFHVAKVRPEDPGLLELLAAVAPEVGELLRRKHADGARSRPRPERAADAAPSSPRTLAAGVAHDITNPLAAVTANLAFVTDEIERFHDRTCRCCAAVKRAGAYELPPCADAPLGEALRALGETMQAALRIRDLARDLRSAGAPDAAGRTMDRTEPTRSRRRTRILVVDDEPLLLAALRRLLEVDHEVMTAADPDQAEALLRAGERFDLLLFDVMMPRRTGVELAQAVARLAPDQYDRVVFMSGGTYAPEILASLERLPHPRIEKPFDPASLQRLIASRRG